MVITEEKVASLFDQANPVPDVEGLDLEDIGAARHLEVLEARSSEVTQLETKQNEQDRQTRSVMPWLAAAIAVLVVGAGILFINQGSDDQVASADIGVVESLVEAWNTQDGEAIASHFTSDAVFDATVADTFLQPWIGREQIAQKTAGYSVANHWENAFDFTQVGEELVFNLEDFDTNFSVERPQGVAVVISDGLIESLVIETDFAYYCIGDTTSRCKVRKTGELKPAE